MPIIDLSPTQLSTPVETPKGFVVTPGQADVDHGSNAPDFSSVLGAAFRSDNTIGSLLAAPEVPDHVEDGFNTWDSIKGTKYASHWKSFVNVRNSRASDAIKLKIDREIEDRRTLDAAPWYQSLPAQMAAGVIDWPTLIPGGAFVRGVRGGISVARSATNVALAAGTSTIAQEAVLQGALETRSKLESGLNIGASVFLGGILGAAGARLLNKAEWNKAVAELERELSGVSVPQSGAPSAAGAAVTGPASLEANAIAGVAAGAVAGATKRINPLLRLFQSPSAVVREVSANLFENATYLKKNFDFVASEVSVETLMKEWNGGLARALRATEGAFSEYSKAGGPMSYHQFREAVGMAMRRGDVSGDPFVTKVANEWRASVFDPLKDAAIAAKLLPEDVTVETATSYFSRMWNRNKLIAQEGKFKDIVRNWVTDMSPRWAAAFDKRTLDGAAKLDGAEKAKYLAARQLERDERFGDAAAIRQAGADVADNVFNTLTGRAESVYRPEFATVGARGPLKERTFSIPDHLVEDFLEHDVDLVGRRYVRVMGADVEMTNKFGSVDMAEQIAKIKDDYAKLRSGISDEKQLKKLGEAEKSDIVDIEKLRDLIRGVRDESPIERNYAGAVRAFNHFNYIRTMGEVVLASLTDAVRPAMVHGLGRFMATLPQLAGNMRAIKMSVEEAQSAGNVAERILGHRMATISELVDPYSSRGPIEAFLENMTNAASKWNGIRIWTDAMQSMASVMTQNRILQGVGGYGSLKAKEKAYLAFLHIDEGMAERIAKQFAEHGETIDRVFIANTQKWTDDVAIRTYRAAINTDVDSIIVKRGMADLPSFAQTPTGRALLQFKSFALASHQRVLLRGLQEDSARFIGGTIAMTAIGMFIAYTKAISGNRPEVQERMLNNPGWWLAEGLDRTGILSIPIEVANAFEKFSGVNPIKSPLRAFDQGGGISQKLQNRSDVGTLLGPTIGMGSDIMTAGAIPKRVIEGEEVTQGQKNAAERLLPFNSYVGMRQILRYIVNPQER